MSSHEPWNSSNSSASTTTTVVTTDPAGVLQTHTPLPYYLVPQSFHPTPNHSLHASHSVPTLSTSIFDYPQNAQIPSVSDASPLTPITSSTPDSFVATDYSTLKIAAPPISPSTSPISTTFATHPSGVLTPAASVTTGPTETSSSSFQKPSQSLSSTSSPLARQPLFIIGVVLGSMALTACLATLVGWLIRTRAHVRRRHLELATDIPWMRPSHGVGGTFAELPRKGSFWEPLPERKLTEPEISDGHGRYATVPPSLPLPVFAMGSGLLYRQSLRQGPAMSLLGPNGSLDGRGNTPTLGPLQVTNLLPGDFSMSSTPASSARSSVNLLNKSSSGVAMNSSSSHLPGVERTALRASWESTPQPRPPDPQGLLQRDQLADVAAVGPQSGWTSSLKSNLIHAFNTVAMTLSYSRPDEKEEIFTPRPERHSRLFGDAELAAGEKQPPSRSGTGASRRYSLKDRGDGAGVVVFPGLDGYEGDLPARSQSSKTQKPKEAYIRPRSNHLLSYSSQGSTGPRAGSQSNSIYSISSATSSVYQAHHVISRPVIAPLTRQSTMTADSLGSILSLNARNDARSSSGLNRLSSLCSMNSYCDSATESEFGSFLDDAGGREELSKVRQAIQDRSRVRKVA